MIIQRRFLLTLALFGIFGLCGSLRASGQTARFLTKPVPPPAVEGGRLTNSSAESKTFVKATSAGRIRLWQPVGGTCDPRPPKPSMQIRALKQSLKVDLSQLGIVVQPAQKDLLLHKFWLEIYSGNVLVFKTLPDCTGCSKSYKGLASASARPSGYVFTLDEKAQALAKQFFVPENRIALKVSGHDGVMTSFYVVSVEP